MTEELVPRRFIRIWLGDKKIPAKFQRWWEEFQQMHRGWKFVTIGNNREEEFVPDFLLKYYYECAALNPAAASDVLRYCVLYEMGGVYLDTDMMPVRSFEPLMDEPGPFIGYQSAKAFATGVIGCPKHHPAMKHLMDGLPAWYEAHRGQSQVYTVGPQLATAMWRDRDDVRKLEPDAFYPCQRVAIDKFIITAFANKKAYAAHYVTGSWWNK